MLYRQGEKANSSAGEYFEDGVVFQKDLGEDTDKLVAQITAFDPDTTGGGRDGEFGHLRLPATLSAVVGWPPPSRMLSV